MRINFYSQPWLLSTFPKPSHSVSQSSLSRASHMPRPTSTRPPCNWCPKHSTGQCRTRLSTTASSEIPTPGDHCSGRGLGTIYRTVPCRRIGYHVHHAPVGRTTLTTVTKPEDRFTLTLVVALPLPVAVVEFLIN